MTRWLKSRKKSKKNVMGPQDEEHQGVVELEEAKIGEV